MEAPYVAFRITPEGELIISTIGRNPMRVERNEPFEYPLPLDIMNEQGLDMACRDLGCHVMGLLNLWHPDVFKKYPNLITPDPQRPPAKPIPENDTGKAGSGRPG